MIRPINPLILNKLAERHAPDYVKGLIKDILLYEQGIMNQERPTYSKAYKRLLNQYLIQQKKFDNQQILSKEG